MLENLGEIAWIHQFVTLLEDLGLEGAEIERQGILHVWENADRIEDAIGIGEIRFQAEQLAYTILEARLAKQRLLGPGRLQEAEILGARIGLHQVDGVGETDEVGDGRVSRSVYGVQFAAPDQRYRGLRIDGRDLACALIVLNHAP